MTEFTLKIDGMHCGSCVRRVGQALGAVPGVAVKEVRVGAARFTAGEDATAAGATTQLALDAVTKAGFKPHLES